jgi:probable rRNA maturation factor
VSVDISWHKEGQRDEDLLHYIADAASKMLSHLALNESELSIVLAADSFIQDLNRTWRDLDEATDVLSFPLEDGDMDPQVNHLGDIVISLDTAAVQAKSHGFNLQDEVLFLLIHGLCHLCGHDHGDENEASKMRSAEAVLLGLVATHLQRPADYY